MVTKVVVAGGTGKLGKVICEVISEHPEFELAAVLNSESDAADYANGEILVDATNLQASLGIVAGAIMRDQKVLIGTSGWSAEKVSELQSSAPDGATVLVVPNFSLGSVLGTMLATIAAPYFDSVEVIETHHPGKIDSPSGTAVRTAELIAAARAGSEKPAAAYGEQEARGQQIAGVPVHALREHGVIATQEVRMGGVGESLEIVHRTISNDSYRAGIKAALEYLRDADPQVTLGLDQVLGLQSPGTAEQPVKAARSQSLNNGI